MTARIIVAAGATEALVEALRWARTPVRVVESGSPGWVWVLPDAVASALDRAVEEVSTDGAALLITVGEWRSELQLWRSEQRVLVLGWESGGATGLDHEDAVSAATELAGFVTGVDARALALLLAGPRPGTGAWRDVVDLLGIPLPQGFPERPPEEILPGRGEHVSTTGLLEAAGLEEDVRWMGSYARWVAWVVLAMAAAMSLGAAVVKGSVVNLAVGLVSAAALAWWVARHRSRRRAA